VVLANTSRGDPKTITLCPFSSFEHFQSKSQIEKNGISVEKRKNERAAHISLREANNIEEHLRPATTGSQMLFFCYKIGSKNTRFTWKDHCAKAIVFLL
jgi:hypothetical protein